MFDKIKEILGHHVIVDESLITKDARLIADLGLNSLDVVNIVVEFEEEFDIEIPDRDIKTLTTVNEIINYLERNIQ